MNWHVRECLLYLRPICSSLFKHVRSRAIYSYSKLKLISPQEWWGNSKSPKLTDLPCFPLGGIDWHPREQEHKVFTLFFPRRMCFHWRDQISFPSRGEGGKVCTYQIHIFRVPVLWYRPSTRRIAFDYHHIALEERIIEPKKNQCGYFHNNNNLSFPRHLGSTFKIIGINVDIRNITLHPYAVDFSICSSSLRIKIPLWWQAKCVWM